MKKILITGADGQLGKCLQEILEEGNDWTVFATDRDILDITDREAVAKYLRDSNIDCIVNCAAYTGVDAAETDELNASLVNTEAVGIIAEQARLKGIKVLHISTDYVFSGENFRPYDEHDEPYPRNIYGRTKLEGEGVLTAFCPDAIIIRTAWLYSEYGRNFVKTMLAKLKAEGTVNVVCDQIGTPTYARDLARTIKKILSASEWISGIYNYTDSGVASWYDFAKAISELSGKGGTVNPILTRDFKTAASRPQYSVLNTEKIQKTYGIEVSYWRDSLAECIKKIGL